MKLYGSSSPLNRVGCLAINRVYKRNIKRQTHSLLVVGVPQSGGLCKLYPSTPPLRMPGHPVFLGNQPWVPVAWLAERLLLAGDIESNPGTGPLHVSRESGASAGQVEETSGRVSLK